MQDIRKREEAKIVVRPDRQLLEEILEILRAREKRSDEAVSFGLGAALARETPSIQEMPGMGKSLGADLYMRLLLEYQEKARQDLKGHLKEAQEELEKRDKGTKREKPRNSEG